ncbi:MAG: FecR domain-containing protein [Candidatus Nanoarchaeia archaeon]|nr:FecR domain-containing protein [Candidatus Nanoarchaeia archaeon]
MAKKDLILFLAAFLLLSSFSSAYTGLAEIPDVGESGCVKGTPGCATGTEVIGPISIPDSLKNPVPADTSSNQEYLEQIRQNSKELADAIKSCEMNVLNCEGECAGLPDSPTDAKSDCFDDCSQRQLEEYVAYESCANKFGDGIASFIQNKVNEYRFSECKRSFDEDSCYGSCSGLDDFSSCIDRCFAILKVDESKVDKCEAEAYSRAEQFVSGIISQAPKTETQERLVPKLDTTPITTKVSEMKGTVSIKGADGAAKTMGNGINLEEGDVINTGKNSKVKLELSDGHSIEVGPGTTLVYSDPNNKELTLVGGKILVFVKKLLQNRRFQIRAIHGAMSVRGTEFVVESNENGTEIFLNEGSLEVTPDSTGEPIMLEAGNAIILQNDGFVGTKQLAESAWNGAVAAIEPSETEEMKSSKASTGILVLIAIFVLIIFGIAYPINKHFAKNKKNSSWGITSLILGILGIVLSMIVFLGLPASFMGIISYLRQRKAGVTPAAKAGLVLSIIGLLLGFLMLGYMKQFS